MRILITGASGFIGSHLGRRLAQEYDVCGIFFQSRQKLPFPAVRLDLTEEHAVAEVVRRFAPHVIVHAAAMSRVIECEDRPEHAYIINVAATARLLHWAERLHAKFVYLSSDQVFSGKKGARRESDSTDPVNRYGHLKREAENLVLHSASRCLVVRSNSVVGPACGWGESFSDMVLSKLRRNEPVVLFEDQYRSPIHIRTMVDVLHAACVEDISGLLHAGGVERLSRLDTGYALARAYGLNPDVLQPGSYLSHPRATIFSADTSFNVARLKQMIPALRLQPVYAEFTADAKISENRDEMD